MNAATEGTHHDLRRLVNLLDLTEEQQDRVFQELAERSPSWTPGMQVGAVAGAATAGKHSEAQPFIPQTGTVPGIYNKKPTAPEPTTPAANTVAPPETPAAPDQMDEILALLDPVQQDTLLKAEMDRAAWWAEILPQITPPDDIPDIGGTPPAAAGETKTYDGAQVLE